MLEKMQNHLCTILRKYRIRKDIINNYRVDPVSFEFHPHISVETQWSYYNFVCKSLSIQDRIMRKHGMDSSKALDKKITGHVYEDIFGDMGFEVRKGNDKTDLMFEGSPYASLKSGVKIQWGLHTLHNLPDWIQELFGDYVSCYGGVGYENRFDEANSIIQRLGDKEVLFRLINYIFTREEGIPFLIVRDVDADIFYRVSYHDFIETIVNNMEFYITKDKGKIVSTIENGSKSKILFEIEVRSDKGNSLLIHGKSSAVINVIKFYNINVEEEYE